jgi:hypothetical protein
MDNQALRPRQRGRRLLIGALLLLLVLACGSSAFLFFKYQRAVNNTSAKEAESIARRIGDIISLPDGKPAVSTVLDKAKLTNETLKERAENGDKLLIYVKAKRLILYRPSTEKVIDMLTIQDGQPSSALTEPALSPPADTQQ